MPSPGRLVLVATPIGNREALSPRARRTILEADVVYCEDTRSLPRLLPDESRLPPRVSCHRDNERGRIERLLADLSAGRTVVYVSEAGMPGIRDPGLALVRAARAAGHSVDVVPGPSAVTCAVALAGFEGPFAFLGFVPRKGAERRAFLAGAARHTETVVLFEAPGRLPALLRDLAGAVPDPQRRSAVIARELTKLHQQVRAGTLAELAGAFEGPVRGEVTVVVGPAAPSGEPDDGMRAARGVLDAVLDPGLRPRERARRIAERTGLSTDEVYRRLTGGAARTSEPDEP